MIFRSIIALLSLCSPLCMANEQGQLVSFLKKDHTDPMLKIGEPTDGLYTATFSSQVWREHDVSPSQWVHHLSYTPAKDTKACSLAVLFITGGKLEEGQKREENDPVLSMNRDTGCWSARLDLVPNQGLSFDGDVKPRFEDGIIAYGFAKFLKTLDAGWLANFAMVKSVTVAMDVLETIYAKETQQKLNGFILTGESKRGWTTWLASAVDRRVKGAIPVVIDFLNSQASLKHHYKRYGFWSPQLKDYEEQGVLKDIDASAFHDLMQLVDPFSYKGMLTLPKLIINAANDQFFVPDSSQFYISELRGPTWLQYVPNVGHHISEQRAHYWPTMTHFVNTLKIGRTLDDVHVVKDRKGRFILKTNEAPQSATYYQAFNEQKADFRYDKTYPQYDAKPIAFKKHVFVPPPLEKAGWYASFVEVMFAGGARVTSEITVEQFVPKKAPTKASK